MEVNYYERRYDGHGFILVWFYMELALQLLHAVLPTYNLAPLFYSLYSLY